MGRPKRLHTRANRKTSGRYFAGKWSKETQALLLKIGESALKKDIQEYMQMKKKGKLPTFTNRKGEVVYTLTLEEFLKNKRFQRRLRRK